MAEGFDTHNRALKLNLDLEIFGTFAEIGAGQEVARHFLRVGGAAGTVAKTMSAYDMKFSDAIYGEGTRYVSCARLRSMLDHEYRLLLDRLAESRGQETRFFVFADTVAARNYAGTNECHGWMGLRFQATPQSEPSDVRLHVNLRDPANVLQQEAIGVLGVNLLYASFYQRDTLDVFLQGLFADLSLERLEIDVLELSGPAFSGLDSRRVGIQLVRAGLAQAVLLDSDFALLPPSETLRKRPLVVERGLFEQIYPWHRSMLESATSRLHEEAGSDREPLSLPELTVNPVAGQALSDDVELQRRLSAISEVSSPMLLTRFSEVYHLTEYLRRYTQEPVRFVLGASTMVRILHQVHYDHLLGGLLEALGRLFAENVKLHVYPMPADAFQAELKAAGVPSAAESTAGRGLVGADTISLKPPLEHLYRYLLESGWVVGL